MSHKIVTREEPQVNSDLIVQLAKQARGNLKFFRPWRERTISPRQFRDEFETVKIALPRQSGHSTAALQLMYENPDALCFVPDASSRSHMRSLLQDFTSDRETLDRIDHHTRIAGAAALSILYVKTRSYVIFDQASQIPQEHKDLIIETFPSEIVLELQ